MSLFSPKREDGRALWRVVFDRVESMVYGESLLYGELEGLLETSERKIIYASVSRANRFLLRSRMKMLAVVPGTGYRVLHPVEHEICSDSEKAKARNRLSRSVDIIHYADRALMAPEQSQRFDLIEKALGTVLFVTAQNTAKLAEHEELIRGLLHRVKKLENGQ